MVKMSNVWDRTAEFLSDNLGAIMPVALVAFFVPTSISGNFQAVLTTANTGLAMGLHIAQLVFAVLSLWGSLAIAAMAIEGGSVQRATAAARDRLLPALAVQIALFVVIFVLFLPIPFLLAASGYDMMALAQGQMTQMNPNVAGAIALYLVVLGLVGLGISARLAVLTGVIVREGKMFGAIPRSWALTRGHTLRIVGVLILFVIVFLVAALAAKTVFGTLFALVAGGGEEGLSLAGVLTAIVTAAVQTAFLVLLPAFFAKLYLALSAESALSQHMRDQ